MDRKAAKEVLRIEGWLARAGGVVARGKHRAVAGLAVERYGRRQPAPSFRVNVYLAAALADRDTTPSDLGE